MRSTSLSCFLALSVGWLAEGCGDVKTPGNAGDDDGADDDDSGGSQADAGAHAPFHRGRHPATVSCARARPPSPAFRSAAFDTDGRILAVGSIGPLGQPSLIVARLWP